MDFLSPPAEPVRPAVLDRLTPDLIAGMAGARSSGTAPQQFIGPDGCPLATPDGTLRDGSASIGAGRLCADSVTWATTPQAALAIKAAFGMLGAPYACGGVGRSDPYRFDCSSLVSRAYAVGAGLPTSGAAWAPSTRDMVPWDGVRLASWASYVSPMDARPGDLVLYDTGGSTYRHVVMLLADGYMLHTNHCGDVAHVAKFRGFDVDRGFLVVRRVLAPGGVHIPDPAPIPTTAPSASPSSAPADPLAGDPKVAVPTVPQVVARPAATPKPAAAPKPVVTPRPKPTPVPSPPSSPPPPGTVTGPPEPRGSAAPTGSPDPSLPADPPVLPDPSLPSLISSAAAATAAVESIRPSDAAASAPSG